MAYLFNDYWEDIGTIKSFFEANLALAAQVLHHSLSSADLDVNVNSCFGSNAMLRTCHATSEGPLQ
jgi:glucose-1-phosphate adenylyltransferase